MEDRIRALMGDEAIEAMHRAAASAAAEAITAVSDPDAPALLRALAVLANGDLANDDTMYGCRVTAIQRGRWTETEPARPVRDLARWRMDQLSGYPHTVPAVAVERLGWLLRCEGNPIFLESWLKERGLRAFASGPSTVRVDGRDLE